MNSWSQKIDQYLLKDEEWKEQIRKIKEDQAAAGGGGYINYIDYDDGFQDMCQDSQAIHFKYVYSFAYQLCFINKTVLTKH